MAASGSPTRTSVNIQTPESSTAAVEASSEDTGKDQSHRLSTSIRSDSDTSIASKALTKPTSSSPLATAASTAAPNFPPPKTDKPRPHVCTTCMRSFARLEHLKRHERSHTKEKPFECPSCTRCFARRDLLLRHQQKLHSTTTPSSRPRNGRRESTTGVAGGRVRKNSIASTPTTSMRPRANTLSHIDTSTIGMMAAGNYGRQFAAMHGHHNSFSGMATNPSFGFRSLGITANSAISGLPRLETHGLPVDSSSGLRTAPPFGGYGTDYDMNDVGFTDSANTINPHALHMHGHNAFSMDSSWDTSQQMFMGMPTSNTLAQEDGFDWVTHGFETQMNFATTNENAIDDSSPSAMSTNSPAQFSEVHQNPHAFIDNSGQGMNNVWQTNVPNSSQAVNSPMSMDLGYFFGDVGQPLRDTISPNSLVAQRNSGFDNGFPTPPELPFVDSASMTMMSNGTFGYPFKHENHASTASTASMDSSLRNSSVTTASSDLVTEHMRNIIVAGLTQSTGFGQHKQSQPAVSSPLSPSGGNKSKVFNAATFPGTQDLQRYVTAYVKYYHPHLPFLHIPTLNFESSEYTLPKASSGSPSHFSAAGGSCLILSIAALGALFENEMTHSRDLFESAKKLISSYLEDRRKSQSGRAQYLPHQRSDREDTPLWLVQAMLLNVVYGHNCGDKQAADIASNHCAALVSLARGAELAKPYPTYLNATGVQDRGAMNMPHAHNISSDGWNMLKIDTRDSDWYEWKAMEERKRTLYAVFVLSSMLVTAYNRAPALTNSEIRLDLPCDEDLWSVDSAHAWRNLGGVAAAETRSVRFASALTHLLTAAQRQKRATAKQMIGEVWQHEESELRPSSFGCLVLINALHNYIWETRQRHLGRQWTSQEIESIHAHIEPALRAWQTAWNSNPTHTAERPNPFGAGPLSADSIPLLDLAYVRLFVDFGRSKEAYWDRNYDAMAEELAKGSDVATNHQSSAENTASKAEEPAQTDPHVQIDDKSPSIAKGSTSDMNSSRPSQRERHLRKAAFYAADHLLASNRLGFNLNEQNARELPIQSVLCACDSAQVLAEWATTVQERVGKFVGVIGRDEIELMEIPAILLLDEEDRKLFSMINELLVSAESKFDFEPAMASARDGGYGCRILVLTSEIMAKTAVWPGKKSLGQLKR